MNIISMTGYGRGYASNAEVSLEIEIKAVNSRYLDFNFRLPYEYLQYEVELRRIIGKELKRGRVDVAVTRRSASSKSVQLSFNKPLFEAYFNLYNSVTTEYCNSQRNPEALARELLLKREIAEYTKEENVDFEDEKQLLLTATEDAIQKVQMMRITEGFSLAKELEFQLCKLENIRLQIVEKAESAPSIYRQKLEERLAKLAPEVAIEPQRIATEIAIFADRVDITEEFVRLRSHFDQILETVEKTPNGRTLDFLVQECGREFNTIASKAQSSEIQTLAVAGKACLEKIREQIQNIE